MFNFPQKVISSIFSPKESFVCLGGKHGNNPNTYLLKGTPFYQHPCTQLFLFPQSPKVLLVFLFCQEEWGMDGLRHPMPTQMAVPWVHRLPPAKIDCENPFCQRILLLRKGAAPFVKDFAHTQWPNLLPGLMQMFPQLQSLSFCQAVFFQSSFDLIHDL